MSAKPPKWVGIILAAMVMAACGQTGVLYLPGPGQPSTPPTATEPAEEDEDDG